ncbi:nucleotidyltransferase domain-containing protein [Parasaccharibacter sp. TMW 2.1884]|uniref:nucleotidyltransferase domain-containing protein n=1 Tax=Parasaccharibacter sp. TMW 2.1884 TaxID=2267834 RepID=UPI0020116784|nr:nucleotidyltransferase domain-containing protein [Parasaccharibacter sp. TMW 2.1884]
MNFDEIMPDYVPEIAPDVREEVMTILRQIERDHDVDILFAVESGSRAWGFPSPDSDYDVRFIYRHRLDWYLSLKPGRDVIELPISDDLDVNGWDLRKALNLLTKPNPTLMEWLVSPVRYLWREEADELAAFARQVEAGLSCQLHYLNLGRNSWRRAIREDGSTHYKRLFYALRPAMALRWMRLHEHGQPPMNFQALCQGCDLPAAVLRPIRELLHLKSRSREQQSGPSIPAVNELIEAEFAHAEAMTLPRPGTDVHEQAEALFRKLVKAQF